MTMSSQAAAPSKDSKYKWKPDWLWIFLILLLHFLLPVIFYFLIFKAQWKTILFTIVSTILTMQGVCAGAHRLWSHKSYKAKLPLRIILCILHSLSFQKTIHHWATHHRVHHKYVDTDSDPYNSRRGFFFSHIGWFLIEPLEEMSEKLKKFDFSDIESDPVVMIQKKYMWWFFLPVMCFAIPISIPMYFWDEDFNNAFFVGTGLRIFLSAHFTFAINSVAHMFGTRPYDKNICPRENVIVSILASGEGWHNYHHTFPWDYKADEFGKYITNFSAGFIDLMALIGWAYDLKTTSKEMIRRRALRTGDGTIEFDKTVVKNSDHRISDTSHVWGWGDDEMDQKDFSFVEILHRKDG